MLLFQYYMTAPELYFESHDGTAIDGVVAHREEQASKIYNNSNYCLLEHFNNYIIKDKKVSNVCVRMETIRDADACSVKSFFRQPASEEVYKIREVLKYT